MNGVEHPESEQLIAYSEQPESVEHQAVGLHLASCGQCRMDLETSTNLRRHAGWISTNLTESSDDIEGEMSDLLNNRLSGQAAAELRERIKQNPAMLREALHYARHHVAMQRNVQVPKVSRTGLSVWDSVKRLIIQSLQFETAVWKLVPVAVVLVAVVTVFGDLQKEGQPLQAAKLVRFDDQPTIQIFAQESQPGIGFFSNTKQTSIPFEGVSVQIKNDQEIVFSWPAIDNAQYYHLKLQVFRNGETVILGRYSGEKPGAIIKLPEPPGQHRYEWVLTGDTINKQSFQTTGGFVVTR